MPMQEVSPSPQPASRHLDDSSALSRRGFLSGLAAAAMATGAVGLEPLVSPRSRAAASEIGPEIGTPRLDGAYEVRINLANRMRAAGIPELHVCNGDEVAYPETRIGNYSKGLPHDSTRGEVQPSAYNTMRNALSTGVPSDFELIPLGGSRKLTNPQAGLAFDTEGYDPHQLVQPPAPAFASAEEAAEMVELYWMALLRDVSFNYDAHDLGVLAAEELSALTGFKGPKVEGVVTTQTLFRDNLPGALSGPYLSQFLLRSAPFGAEYVPRRIKTLLANTDKVTTFAHWLAVQNGNVPQEQSFDPTRRYIRNGRDLAQWVHVDVLFQAYFEACLILATPPDPSDPTNSGIGCPPNPGNPYLHSETQDGFATWGPPAFKTLLCEVATRALKAVWFQKWFVHRRLRPEEFGGRIHVHKSGIASYPIHAQVLNSSALSRIKIKFGTYLLPQVFPEGSPTHPAFGAGHATVAGACVTVLKALFDGSFVVPGPVVASSDGLGLTAYSGPALTVTGELNKLASNIGTGRNHAGVHWRSDAVESFKLGEAVAIQVLRDHKDTFNEGGSFIFQKFDGTTITI